MCATPALTGRLRDVAALVAIRHPRRSGRHRVSEAGELEASFRRATRPRRTVAAACCCASGDRLAGAERGRLRPADTARCSLGRQRALPGPGFRGHQPITAEFATTTGIRSRFVRCAEFRSATAGSRRRRRTGDQPGRDASNWMVGLHHLSAGLEGLAADRGDDRSTSIRMKRHRHGAWTSSCASRACRSSGAPYLSFPITDARKTGILTPEIGSTGRSGNELSVPFYWNIAPNYDATITPRLLTERGLQFGAEFRYLIERTATADRARPNTCR